MKNKNGFTLVELLAVIVILAVVMMIGITAVGPLMARARKNALITEATALTKAAQTAFQYEQLSSNLIVSTTTVCFNMKYLYNKGYYEKGSGKSTDGYTGSVLVKYIGNDKYEILVWLSNGTYILGKEGQGLNPKDYDINDQELIREGSSASDRCGINGLGTTTTTNNRNQVYCYEQSCGKTNIDIVNK